MGNIFSIRLTDEDKIHLQQRMNETGKNATEVFKSAIYFTEIDADLVDEIISNIGYYAVFCKLRTTFMSSPDFKKHQVINGTWITQIFIGNHRWLTTC